MFTMSEERPETSSRRASVQDRPAPPLSPSSSSSSGQHRMNTAGRYQSRRATGRAFEPLGERPALQVRAEPRRDSVSISSGGGRRRSVAITGMHVEVSKPRESEAAAARLQAALQGGRQRRSFLEAVRPELAGEPHQQLLQAHGDIVTRSVPPQLNLELYREVTPILASCVKTYTRSLGGGHPMTAECVKRHQECAQRLRQLEAMHATSENGGEAATA